MNFTRKIMLAVATASIVAGGAMPAFAQQPYPCQAERDALASTKASWIAARFTARSWHEEVEDEQKTVKNWEMQAIIRLALARSYLQTPTQQNLTLAANNLNAGRVFAQDVEFHRNTVIPLLQTSRQEADDAAEAGRVATLAALRALNSCQRANNLAITAD